MNLLNASTPTKRGFGKFKIVNGNYKPRTIPLLEGTRNTKKKKKRRSRKANYIWNHSQIELKQQKNTPPREETIHPQMIKSCQQTQLTYLLHMYKKDLGRWGNTKILETRNTTAKGGNRPKKCQELQSGSLNKCFL